MTTAGTIREGFACRLCWRITFAVFVLILVVESILLVPSAIRFERLELDRLAERAEGWIEPLLALSGGDADTNALARDLAPLIGRYEIEAIAIYRSDGSLAVAVGQAPPPLRAVGVDGSGRMARVITRNGEGSMINVAWRSRSSGAPMAVARVDSSHVREDLVAYLLRIGGLVALIVLVVTAGTMVVLDRWVLRAVLGLRKSALNAAADPDHADQFAVATRRQDEMGELIVAHNSMLVRVAESKRRDIEMAEERARYLARHQPLTGLPNREALIEYVDFLEYADSPGARPGDSGRCVSLILLNLVQFRALNASFGTTRCDELLKQMAARLRRVAPSRDFIAHLGADRFTVVHDGTRCDVAGVTEIAQTLLRELGANYELGGADVASLTLRIGIGQSAGRTIDGRTLLNEAELALASTAESDGAKYLFFSPDLAAQARDRQRLARDLERAIQQGELFPVLQPKWALRAEGGVRLAGAEALVRWRDPERGLVRPDQFIPIAESTGLIEPIGEFMLRSACRTMRDWNDRFGWSPGIAINLTAQQFADVALPLRLKGALREAGVPAGLLEVEITESAAMKDVVRSAATLRSLHEIGVRVSIDDFGTGYSSLSYLRRFAVDAIKIDKSFVDDIGSDGNADAICDAILRLGQSLGTKVIAEGVETEIQMAFLRQRRCNEVQGYLLGKPVTLDEFEKTYLVTRAAV
ncbi:MAG: EAL domain-containing protein [Betaproteobacteria bacterium]|nr:EAL domain-containing protein [Betaproteobacteria bacterium]